MKASLFLSVLISAIVLACSSPQTTETKSWHSSEGLDNEPISLPSCDLRKVKNIRIGDKIEDIERIVGYPAVQYYYGADYLTLHAADPAATGFYWEVALRHEGTRAITDISFKKITFEPL